MREFPVEKMEGNSLQFRFGAYVESNNDCEFTADLIDSRFLHREYQKHD